MEYVKGKPYFCYCNEKIKQYSYLCEKLECEILIIGGGIDGAIANYYLSKNHDVALVDKGRFGFGLTSCATALLEYQLDDFAEDLKEYMSEEEIVLAYRSGLDAVEKIKQFIKEHGNKCEFNLRPTFLFTNSIFSVKAVEKEFEFRKKNGFDVEFFDPVNNPFQFEIKSGIYCKNGGCEFNPYLFAKQMIENSNNQNKMFENTKIAKIEKEKNGYVAVTNFGDKIFCKKILVATGFNWEVLEKENLCERFVTYSIVTEPIKNFSWFNKAMIHDASQPYHYLRLLPDNRIIYGGEDVVFKNKPISERKANKKYDKLAKDLFKMFPEIDGAKINYKFCGLFGATNNNMGLIGPSGFDENILLFISCGANGIINAINGVEVIEDYLSRKENKLSKIFLPSRE